MMADASARILRLLSLLEARLEWPGGELAERLAVSSRTLRRDVETLRELGYPVDTTKGPGGGYRLGAGGKLPPLVLDDDQAIAIAIALQTAPATVKGIDDGVQRALSTLRKVMPARLRATCEEFEVTSLRNYWEFAPPPVDVATLQAVGSAIRTNRTLRFEYATTNGSIGVSAQQEFQPSVEVEPHHLVVWAGRWYLIAREARSSGERVSPKGRAHVEAPSSGERVSPKGRAHVDVTDQSWQTYRVDRIDPQRSTGAAFTPQPLTHDDLTELVVRNPDRGDTPGNWQCVGTATLQVPAEIVARWAPGGSVVTPIDEQRCRLTIGGWSWVGIAGLFITFDTDLDDITPPALVEAFSTIQRRLSTSVTSDDIEQVIAGSGVR
jgi:biotin operon repressor